ncbi:MAG TPA: hypothetical protein EYP22_10555 [Methanosarcinales archaeon]|nr:hypothetical protein [Methanosarcinales archaeon]
MTLDIEQQLKDCQGMNKALTVLAGETSRILEDLAGTEAAKKIFQKMGERAGRRFAKKRIENLGKIDTFGDALDAIADKAKAWYNIEIDEMLEGCANITVINCFIKNILIDRGFDIGAPLCGITRGYIIGALEELTGKKADIKFGFGDLKGVCREQICLK